MGITWQSIQKEICQAVPCKMFCKRQALCKNQPFSVNPSFSRLKSQIIFNFCMVTKKPEIAIRYLLEDPHPPIKGSGSNFIAIVKTTENKSCFRQTKLFAGKHVLGNTAQCIIRLITIGEISYFFSVIRLAAFRYQYPVSNEIINKISTHCTRITKIVNLYRRCPEGKYSGSGISGETLQVNGNINLQIPRQDRHISI